MKLVNGLKYCDDIGRTWQFLGKSGRLHFITLIGGSIGFSTTCNHRGRFVDGPNVHFLNLEKGVP